MLLEIQTNCKKLVSEVEKSVKPSLDVFTPPNLEIFNPENVKKIKNVFTLGPMAQATPVELPTTE